jgi:Ca2+-binding RTX toxin-like protein
MSDIEQENTRSFANNLDAEQTRSQTQRIVTVGGFGDDTLEGGSGDDIFDASSGADTIIGGRGDDTYCVDFVGPPEQVSIEDSKLVAGHSWTDVWVSPANQSNHEKETFSNAWSLHEYESGNYYLVNQSAGYGLEGADRIADGKVNFGEQNLVENSAAHDVVAKFTSPTGAIFTVREAGHNQIAVFQ